MATEPFQMKVWRCHPQSAPIVRAEKTCHGFANESGVKWCGPFTSANKSGWWLFPPVDIDICWKGGKEFEHRLHTPFDDSDYHLVRQLLLPSDQVDPDRWSIPGGRTKFSWGMVEDGVVQMWTGCIFETPPGWCLHIRSPVNFPPRSCYVMEGVLETDWMQYDIWTNLVFTKPGEWVELRREGWPPLAQLIPVRREGFQEKWEHTEEILNRDTPEANRVFEYWCEYNNKKFGSGGKQNLSPDGKLKKDSTTYHRERHRCLGKEMEPDAEQIAPHGCPYHRTKTNTVVYCVNDKPLYVQMALNSIRMLRKYNQSIPVKLFYISDQPASQEFADLNVEVLIRPWYMPEYEYFSVNKAHLRELPEDSVLYLDADTFIFGDVGELFDRYRTDFTAVENSWVYSQGWNEDFLPNKVKPFNAGVQLFHGGYHRTMFERLPDAFVRMTKEESPLASWVRAYHNGCLREEFACCVIAAESEGIRYEYFKKPDVYNIQRKEDVPGCHESIIFHSYTKQWEMVNKWLQTRRKVVWPRARSGSSNQNPSESPAE